MTTSILSLLVATLSVVVHLASASAASNPVQACAAAVTKASGKLGQCRLSAEAAFATSGNATKRSDALAKCTLKFETSFSKARTKYGSACPAVEPPAAFEAFIQQSTDDVSAAAGGAPFPVCGSAATCGDGTASGQEACDGADLAGSTCQSLGLGGGTLACSASCTFDTSGCTPCNDLVYVIDQTSRLLSFDPRKLDTTQDPFRLVGTLDCPAAATPVPGWPGGVTPYSIAVDRAGTARVLYSSGELFTVNLADGSCASTSFQPEQGDQWLVFQSAFSTDASGGTSETLFVGGGSPDGSPGGLLGSVNPTTLQIQNRGTLPSQGDFSPMLTGTGHAELFAFFPGLTTASVQQIDKATGAAVGSPLAVPGGVMNTATAWAFAHWGGRFFLFLTTTDNFGVTRSTVAAIDRATGMYQVVSSNVPYVAIAAGVATCAPTEMP